MKIGQNPKYIIYLSHFNLNISRSRVHITYGDIDTPENLKDLKTYGKLGDYKKLEDYKINKPKPICNANLAWYVKPIDISHKENIENSLKCRKCFKKLDKLL